LPPAPDCPPSAPATCPAIESKSPMTFSFSE
jgi:hypothetical protein